jgi:hypothetical protein
MPKSKSVIALAAVAIIIITAFSVYAGVTYPRTAANIPVSFTIGADAKTTAFDQPFLDNKVQVQVTVHNGAALWQAQIISQSNVIWEHSAGQGEQTSYNSGWIELPSGNYNFTFRTVGVGSLNAVATVTSKGGFW